MLEYDVHVIERQIYKYADNLRHKSSTFSSFHMLDHETLQSISRLLYLDQAMQPCSTASGTWAASYLADDPHCGGY